MMPVSRLRMIGFGQECGVFTTGYRCPCNFERVSPDPMARPFPQVVVRGSHPEPSSGNGDELHADMMLAANYANDANSIRVIGVIRGLSLGVVNLVAAGASFVQLSPNFEELIGILFLDGFAGFV